MTTTVPWTPPRGNDIELVKVGPHWDVLRAPAEIGERALGLLDDASGAVIADYSLMYWLIPSGDAQCCRDLRKEIHILGADGAEVSYIGVPPAGRTEGPGLHWRIPVGPDRYLTDLERLCEALARVIAAETAEDATAR
ncbi:hypothetical protein [Streptomyces botrytidirepellens]|uniref:Uncharacterized protein n=1 Tax=Streptomyces botrytidirepellens TaxID=2486417 RepID=A0A3M8XA52_9ACTN|nr:hypothetical protein [Streptomyces botrytidirepellens]RNG38030.1 hypothetical protein EEJ42_01940 [Streptomyces botrytidirepellens]